MSSKSVSSVDMSTTERPAPQTASRICGTGLSLVRKRNCTRSSAACSAWKAIRKSGTSARERSHTPHRDLLSRGASPQSLWYQDTHLHTDRKSVWQEERG